MFLLLYNTIKESEKKSTSKNFGTEALKNINLSKKLGTQLFKKKPVFFLLCILFHLLNFNFDTFTLKNL